MRKKWFLAIFLAVLTAGAASAQITISGGFALSYMNATETVSGGTAYHATGDIGAGGNIYIDYLLPIGIPLSLGAEVGVDTSSFSDNIDGKTTKDTVLTVPILLRAAYHFDINPKIDLYLVGKAGFALGHWSGQQRDMIKNNGITVDPDPPMGFGFGFDLGVAYYFLPHFGIFAEGGFDAYMLQTKMSGNGYSGTLDAPFYRFVTIGISTKF